jgi:16S rRNA (adenine1518-N6/adenine1519-N6)-dimethyltransferase
MIDMRAKKSLGQHFLNSGYVLEQIISAARIKEGEIILEIGPGTGFLTAALLNTGAQVIAVEKDDRAEELLKEKFSIEIGDGQLRLIHGDILDPEILHFPFSIFHSGYSIVANIPYYITGAILEKFLAHEPRPSRMVLLVQKEVADRISARDGKESILSISVKASGTPRIIAKVSRGAFTPAPKVDSAILAIDDISGAHFRGKYGHGKNTDREETSTNVKRFFDIVRAGFAHKRKLLKRNLEAIIDRKRLDTAWKNLGLDEKVRAENITVEQWFSLSTELRKTP